MSSSQSTGSASLPAPHPLPQFSDNSKVYEATVLSVRSCQIIDFNCPIFLLEVGKLWGEFAFRFQLQPCALVASCDQ